MRKYYPSVMFVLSLVTAGLLLGGCGSGKKEGAADPIDPPALVDESSCTSTCHATSVAAWGWPSSKHALSSVGCQDCHGNGGNHFGIGPLPYPEPGSDQCAPCHSAPVTAFVAGNHGPTNFTLEYAEDEAHRKCARCHSHEGALFSNVSGFTGDDDTLTANADKAPPIDADGSQTTGMKCMTCHTTHKTEDLRVPNTVVAGAVVPWQPSLTVGITAASSNKQFNLCTSCHNYTKPDGTLIASGINGTAKFYHNTSWYRIIGTTHYDDPATTDTIEGYVLRTNGPNSASPCFDCHAHDAKTNTRYAGSDASRATIHTDWAQSGHGGSLLTAKYAAAAANPVTATRGTAEYTTQGLAQVTAVLAAGVKETDEAGSWAEEGGVGTGSSCARCHTATGAASYLNGPSSYDPATLDFSHRTAGQKEMLYCWGCHSNAGDGTTRTPGPITALYTYNTAAITFPDVNNSNICMACHSSRRNVIDNSRSTGFRPHYLPAGGILFSSSSHMMYEFDVDADGDRAEHYTNPAYFRHDKIGTSSAAGTGTSGPCVMCHMSEKTHTFSPVTKSGGIITAIKGQTTCNVCHTTYPIDAAKLQEESEGYQEAGVVLAAYLTNTITNAMGINITAVVTDAVLVPDIRYYGAYQNSLLPAYEKGGYAHNRYYVKRLLFDSIDWVDNGQFDGTITINPTTYPKAAHWFGANTTTGVAARP